MTGKKILFTSHTANFSKFNRPLTRWLREQGSVVHYASAGEEAVLDIDKHFTIPFARSPFSLSNIRAYRQLKKLIDEGRYDLIHTHTPMGSVVTRLAAHSARKRFGTRVMYTAHGFHFFKGASLLNWLIYYPVERLLAKKTDTLITINKEDYERATAQFKTDVRYVAGVGIDQDKFDRTLTKQQWRVMRRSLNLNDDDVVMLYLAELSKRKNHLWLIPAVAPLMRRNPKLHLLLAGMDSLNGQCQKLVRELGLENNIHFLGYRKDIVELLRSSDFVVSSSLQEGLPVNIMEAMYTGLPIVAVDCRGSRDLIQHNDNGFLVPKGDAASMQHGIERLHDDGALRAQFSERSKAIIQGYLLPDILRDMANIYNQKPVIVHLLNSNKFSGAENVASELIKNSNQAFDAYYCSPRGSINEALESRDVRHIAIDKLSYGEVKRIISQYKPTVIHAHDFRASIIASLFTRQTKVISHIHQNPTWLNGHSPFAMAYKLRIKSFAKVLVVTDAIKQNTVFGTLPADKVATYYNLVDKEAILAKGGKDTTKTYDIAFCGRLESVKQPLDFIRVVAEIKKTHKQVTAVMVGDGSLEGECSALINQLGLSRNIRMVGFQANPYPYMKQSRFLMITSEAEGFGLVAIEAMLLGAVVVSYDIESIREIMGTSSNTIGSSVEDLAALYHTFTSSPQSLTTQIKQNQHIAEAFAHTAESKQHSILSLYKDVL